MERSKQKLIIKIINIFFIAFMAAAALAVGWILKDDWFSPQLDYTIPLDKGWVRINSDGTHEEVEGKFSIGKSDPVTFYRVLPDEIDDESIMHIKCPYYTVDAAIDGKSIYHAGPGKIGNIETTLGNIFALIPLKEEYSGKTIYITVEPRHYNYEVFVKDALITNMSTYSFHRLTECLPYIILCAIIMAVSFISLIVYLLFRFVLHRRSGNSLGLLLLSFFGSVVSVCVISDYHIIGMLTGRMILSGLITYVSFMLCPVAFSMLLYYVFDKKPIFRIFFIISEICFVSQIILFLLGITDIPNGLLVFQILTIFIIIGMVYYGIDTIRRSGSEKTFILAIPTTAFVIFVIVAAILYALNGKWMLYFTLAMFFYTLTVSLNLLINLWRTLKNSMELDQVKKLAYYDNLTGLENRRSYKDYVETLNEKIKDNNSDHTLSAIMLDVNGLKKTNDIYGHKAGDELLTGSSECIKNVFKSVGRCFRTGGDEFVVLADIEHDEFEKKASELKDMLSAWKGDYIDGISISVGKADSVEFPDYDADKLLIEADKRMYEDKQNYYASQLMEAYEDTDNKSTRRQRYADDFDLTKYTMPIIRQMAEVIPGGFFIYKEDETRELIYQNQKVLDIYGCKTLAEFKELTGYNFEHMVYPEDFKRIQDSIDAQIDSSDGDGMDHVIYRITRRDGQIRWVDDYGHFSHSPDYGDIYYVFISDITERVEASEIK